MDRNKVKAFWETRAKLTELPRIESMVNFETDKNRADSRINAEIACINNHFPINPNDTIIDLGAGNGQWSIRFSSNAKKVIAVEYTYGLIETAKQIASQQGVSNIDFIHCAAEMFVPSEPAEAVFVSGLFNYLDDEQYIRLLDNIPAMLTPDSGHLFLRETVSTLEHDYIIDNEYSEALGTNYFSLYRTDRRIVSDIQSRGMQLIKKGFFFEDGSFLNKWTETRLMYFLFVKC